MSEPASVIQNGIVFEQAVIRAPGGKRVKTDGLTAVTFRHGPLSHNPALQFFIGAGFLSVAGFLLIPQVRWYLEDGSVFVLFLAMFAFTLTLGSWVTGDAFRQGWFCTVVTHGRETKLSFQHQPTVEQLDAVAVELKARFAWNATRE